MANWNDLKLTIESRIQKSGISDKESIKLILRFHRRINTCQNFLNNGSTYETMCETFYPFTEADNILKSLKENHKEDFFKYCDASGYVRYFDCGDMMA